ncbi:hypothetical protein X801_01656, partial [Opisthorchis viverrini]
MTVLRPHQCYFHFYSPTLVYYPPRITNTRNLDARTWIVGNVRGGALPTENHVTAQSKSPDDVTDPIVGVCMADGTVLLMNPATEDEAERVLWCIQLHFRGELFGLSKVNLTRGHTDELCVCAWDGTTYVFNHRKQILRFPMGQSCQAFLAGWYAVEPGRNEPVFVYATCEHSLLIYHNLNVDHLVEPCLFHELSNDASIASSLQALQIDLPMSTTLWTPSSNSGISMLEFMHFVEQKHNLNFGGDYHKFYTWSIEQLNQFWLDFFFHACVRHSVPPTQAIDTTAKMSSIPKWFPDCRLNYAENILSGGKPPDVALLAF